MHTEMIDYRVRDTQIEGYVVWEGNISGQRPALLVAHDWTVSNERLWNISAGEVSNEKN
jgi:hypothetical protein